MRARTVTPADLFAPDTRHVVPLFQRPYVWTKDQQWQPLWHDIRLLAEGILSGPSTETHFLGAIVLEPVGTTNEIIDGQQRLVTLQLLLHAVATVAGGHGNVDTAAGLLRLVHRSDVGTGGPDDGREDRGFSDERFKVWPGARDQDAYRAALAPDAPPPAAETGAVATAHSYLVETVGEWAGSDAPTASPRLRALATVLRERVVLVAIDLDSSDNAQVIFESLNHRATPLLAADLIKNVLFRAVQQQGLDALALHEKYWAVLDSWFWRRHDPANVDSRPRLDTFVRHWLVTRLLREVPEGQLVESFRAHLADGGRGAQDILADLATDAQLYATLESAKPGTDLERFRYRVLEVLELQTLTPLVLLMLRWRRDRLGKEQFDKALAALESWAVRRGLCQLKNPNTLSIVVKLVQTLQANDPGRAGDVTEAFLARLTAQDSWPTDDALRAALTSPGANRVLQSKRARLLLEAVEDAARKASGARGPCPRGLTVEHLMPTGWRAFWPPDPADPMAGQRRDRLVEAVGNLVLVPERLNKRMAHLPWTDVEAAARRPGATGKRSQLATTNLVTNAAVVAAHPHAWTDEAIRLRSQTLAAAAVAIWPRPGGAAPGKGVLEYEAPGPSGSRYRALTMFLTAHNQKSLRLSFAEVEDLLGSALPKAARSARSAWTSPKSPLSRSIVEGGYQVAEVKVREEMLELRRTKLTRVPQGGPGPTRQPQRRGARRR